MTAQSQPFVHETKFAPVDLERVDTDGSFTGYASLFGKADLGRDMVLPGAFADSIAARGASGIKLLYQHDPAEPIGVWREIREDEKGLYVRGQLMGDVARAREVLSLMRAGALDGLSIGFRTVKGRTDPKSGLRRIEKVDLWEISIVTFPMLPEARVSAVKHWRPGATPTRRQFERWLTREAGFSRSQVRGLMRSGFKGLAAMQDAGGDEIEMARFAHKLRRAASTLNAKR